MTLQLSTRRFTVDEYEAMGRAGILAEDERVELIEGQIVAMSPVGSLHQARVDRLAALFFAAVGALAQVRTQGPVRANQYSEPQPDLVLLRSRPDFYETGPPTPAEVLLLIEVSDTTLEQDRRIKVPLYARSGIPEVWLEEIAEDAIRVFREPAAEGYAVAFTTRRGDHLSPLAFPDLSIPVADLLGPERVGG
jgi:Uma2 family endonuclease